MSWEEELKYLAAGVVREALESGASDAECTIAEGDEFSAGVRMGEIENLKEAGSRGAGIRVLIGKRMGSAYTSDLTPDGLRSMVRSAVDLASITTEDPFAGLPDPEELGSLSDRDLYSPAVEKLETDFKIEQARKAEAAALAYDPRISNSEGGSFDSFISGRAFANSRGFAGAYRYTSCSITVIPVAKDGNSMERDYWSCATRKPERLEEPADIGTKAAQRALRRLGARKVATQSAAIVFEPRMARSLLDDLFDAVNGGAIYRKSSFLVDKLGEEIASPLVTIVDDGTIPAAYGTSPFDDEGVPTRRTVVVDKGVLKSYLLNSYTARKLGMNTTGNASRGLSGNAGVSYGNFYVENGSTPPDEIVRSVKKGLYVTEMIGSGYNPVTGDYSRGAVGLWIENGELTFPVSEVTIAGNLGDMLKDVEMVGNDLEFRTSLASPTLLVREMMISGHGSQGDD